MVEMEFKVFLTVVFSFAFGGLLLFSAFYIWRDWQRKGKGMEREMKLTFLGTVWGIFITLTLAVASWLFAGGLIWGIIKS